MSRHWAGVPPDVHLNTGRLCSAGSGCHPVPRRPRAYAALRLPAPISPGSGAPCRWPPSMRVRVLCPLGRRHVHPPTCRASETGHRRSARPACVEERRGPPRFLDRPLRACSGRTPRRRRTPPCPFLAGGVVAFDDIPLSRHPARREVSGPQSHGPHVRLPTPRGPCFHDRRQACARLRRAHPEPGGMCTRWTTHKVS
jgi:hypothetical protein